MRNVTLALVALASWPLALQAQPVSEAQVGEEAVPDDVRGVILRSQSDIIKGVLNAQAAAWNEGDLEAFMEGYWRSDELRFVSGGAVTRGWHRTMRNYRRRYGEGDAMGRLGFEGLNVQFVSADVAVVVGRFLLEREAGPASGAFSLVMKQVDGNWRIVHDHTTADAPEEVE